MRAGIAISRYQVSAVILEKIKGKYSIRRNYNLELPTSIFTGSPTTEAIKALNVSMDTLSKDLNGEFSLIHVAFPDTFIRNSIFELDEMPKNEKMRNELTKWRFAKDWQRSEGDLECRSQDMGQFEGKFHLFAQAGDRAWIDCVRQSLDFAKLKPSSMNSALVYRYNRFHNQFSPGHGAMLSLDPDCWTLLSWNGQFQFKRIVTRLRVSGDGSDLEHLKEEVVRSIKTGAIGRIDQLYVTASSQQTAVIKEGLSNIPGLTVSSLNAAAEVSGKSTWTELGMGQVAIAAALST